VYAATLGAGDRSAGGDPGGQRGCSRSFGGAYPHGPSRCGNKRSHPGGVVLVPAPGRVQGQRLNENDRPESRSCPDTLARAGHVTATYGFGARSRPRPSCPFVLGVARLSLAHADPRRLRPTLADAPGGHPPRCSLAMSKTSGAVRTVYGE
jgi:hypothetical protein